MNSTQYYSSPLFEIKRDTCRENLSSELARLDEAHSRNQAVIERANKSRILS